MHNVLNRVVPVTVLEIPLLLPRSVGICIGKHISLCTDLIPHDSLQVFFQALQLTIYHSVIANFSVCVRSNAFNKLLRVRT